MSLRDKVKRSYQQKQNPRQLPNQTEPQPNLSDILWLQEQTETSRRAQLPRPRATKKAPEVLRKLRKY